MLYKKRYKPNIKFQLIETNKSDDYDNQTGIDIEIMGPFTYEETNSRWGTKIPYGTDSE